MNPRFFPRVAFFVLIAVMVFCVIALVAVS